MNLLNWLKRGFSARDKALSLYRQGMKQARAHKYRGAIHDYTATIDMPDAPPDVKAMARYNRDNRALVYAASGDNPAAVDDLNFVLAMKETLTVIKSAARLKLERIRRQSAKQGLGRTSIQRLGGKYARIKPKKVGEYPH